MNYINLYTLYYQIHYFAKHEPFAVLYHWTSLISKYGPESHEVFVTACQELRRANCNLRPGRRCSESRDAAAMTGWAEEPNAGGLHPSGKVNSALWTMRNDMAKKIVSRLLTSQIA